MHGNGIQFSISALTPVFAYLRWLGAAVRVEWPGVPVYGTGIVRMVWSGRELTGYVEPNPQPPIPSPVPLSGEVLGFFRDRVIDALDTADFAPPHMTDERVDVHFTPGRWAEQGCMYLVYYATDEAFWEGDYLPRP